jgi:hypothetical protein
MIRIKIDIHTCNGLSSLNGEPTYQFTDKEAANDVSEQLKEEWERGFGQVYGPFLLEDQRTKVWEVTIPPERS